MHQQEHHGQSGLRCGNRAISTFPDIFSPVPGCPASIVISIRMSSDRSSTRFSFLDIPRALWFFLGPERWSFLFFSGVLLTVFCYVLVPPYIVGLIATFLIDYVRVPATDRPPLS